MKKLNIAIIGLGNIGSYLFNIYRNTKPFYQKKTIVFQISSMFQQKIKKEKEALRLIQNYG